MNEFDDLGLCELCRSDYSEAELGGKWLCGDCLDDYRPAMEATG
jgi:hypothetical protein